MVTIVTRAGKGSELTHAEGDANFNNLNTGKMDTTPPTSSGTNTVTASYDPTISAYTTGQVYEIQVGGTNTGAVTLNIDSVGATAVQTVAGTALVGSELVAGQIARFLYNGTNFRLLNPDFRPFRGCLVFLDANQANTGTLDIPFNQEDYDTDTIHDNATNNTRLTVPTGVTYVRLTGQVTWQSSAFTSTLVFNLNGGTGLYAGSVRSEQDNTRAHLITTPVLSVTGGDYFELEASQDSGGTINILGEATGYRTWAAMEIVL